ncbi:hypothetical protein [uncultured Methanobrevibacter sp.]|uniref:hypothetical protein n=1 Tax=uncultured Methanobrevibacter sp. TaxID=253161 RepID=UPI0025CC9C57|nr:hypothetical protein [uncultured Methanobrevibacter sp.]
MNISNVMRLLDANGVPRLFSENIFNYLRALQEIAEGKNKYQHEDRRSDLHKAIVENVLLPMLGRDADTDIVYNKSKELLANLDKIWGIYDMTPFDLLDDNCLVWLTIYMWTFFSRTECKNFLEGKSDYIHGIHII